MRRRRLLASALAGSLSLAGCLGGRDPFGPDLPEDCPTSQDLGVEWPRDLDESTAGSFVEAYEERYYREVVFDYEPVSRYSSVGSAISRVKDVTGSNGGWQIRFSGVLGVNKAFMHLQAARADPRDDANVIPRSKFDDERLRDLLDEAAETGEADREIETDEVDAFVDRFETLSDGFELSPAEPRDALYVDVNGTTVELTVSVHTFHADRFWDAWYYVDEHVVWRSGDNRVDPRDGELLECRTPG